MMDTGGVVLLYHRVTRLGTDPQLLAVSPDHFAAQMDALKQISRPMALGEMLERARRGEDLRDAVAITFDDGYADNLLEAAPILHSSNIPATVFVASGGIDSTAEFFWDELDRIFLQPGRLPDRIKLQFADSVYEGELCPAGEYSQAQWEQFREWNVTLKENPAPRQRVYSELCGLTHQMSSEQRNGALRQIQAWAKVGEEGRRSHRMMNSEQLRELARSGLIEIGGHTVTHPLLARENRKDQLREIAVGKLKIEAVLGRRIRGFSYPFGGRRDYTGDSVAAVKSAGFDYACSNFAGVVNAGTDFFQLPRVLVRDWSAGEFQSRLGSWLTAA
jgi:peptidoglycan/xylan/chitin deacetylase (PgdA/CDA1 family)